MKLLKAMAILFVSIASSLQAASASAPQQNIVQIAQGNADFSTLVTALSAADLVDTLSGAGPFTVFAPTNEAFAKLPPGTVQSLLADKAALTKILTYHVVAGNESPRDLVCNNTTATLEGDTVTVERESDGKLEINSSNVIARPIRASNGIIYVIDAVLLPN
jgi:uncharacterized surface protein with fasciclin (FAS1) repeats